VLGESHSQIQIAGRASAQPGFPPPRQPKTLAFRDTGRDAHLKLIAAADASAPAAIGANMLDANPAATAFFTRHLAVNGDRAHRSV
jgi:hypothetical protein